MSGVRLGIRWTIGNVNKRGFEALQLSIWGAWNLFGPDACYAVCFNQVPLERVRRLTGEVPAPVKWCEITDEVPVFIRAHLNAGMAEGVGWKFAPLQVFPDLHELALDNDCILWEMPGAIREWIERADSRTCVIAEDVRTCFGQFAHLCGQEPRNSGIRGLPAGFDYEAALRNVLDEHPVTLTSELDEQGLQIAAMSRFGAPLAVTLEEVTICSPFWPHLPHLGRCGAHFVGLNSPHIPWSYYDRPADEWMAEHWEKHRAEIVRRVHSSRYSASEVDQASGGRSPVLKSDSMRGIGVNFRTRS